MNVINSPSFPVISKTCIRMAYLLYLPTYSLLGIFSQIVNHIYNVIKSPGILSFIQLERLFIMHVMHVGSVALQMANRRFRRIRQKQSKKGKKTTPIFRQAQQRLFFQSRADFYPLVNLTLPCGLVHGPVFSADSQVRRRQ